MLAIKAVELAREGLRLNDILSEINACRDRMETVFTLDKLDNIIKGGRLTKFEGLSHPHGYQTMFQGIEGHVEVVEKSAGPPQIPGPDDPPAGQVLGRPWRAAA
jgi:fatty acid-binding protein DegV